MGLFNDAGEAFNQATDTIGDAAEKAVSDAGEAFNQVTTTTFGDAAPEVVDTSSQDLTSRDAALALFDYVRLLNPIGQMMLVSEAAAGSNRGLHNEDVRDKLVDALPQVVSNSVKSAGEAVNQVTDTAKKTVDKTVNNVLPADTGKNLGLALYGILAVAGIAVFVYILSLLKPLFEIGSNVSEK